MGKCGQLCVVTRPCALVCDVRVRCVLGMWAELHSMPILYKRYTVMQMGHTDIASSVQGSVNVRSFNPGPALETAKPSLDHFGGASWT